jgi:hypothetical protein
MDMRILRLAAIVGAALAMSGCGLIDMNAPCYTCGTGYYDSTPCTYDAQGVPSPGCYDYLFEDDYGNPLPPASQPYEEPVGEPEAMLDFSLSAT